LEKEIIKKILLDKTCRNCIHFNINGCGNYEKFQEIIKSNIKFNGNERTCDYWKENK